MAVKLLRLFLLLASLFLSWAEKQTCHFATTCRECILEGPGCAWCTDLDLPEDKLRCNTLEQLQGAGCGRGHIYHPQGSVEIVKNDSMTSEAEPPSIQLQPQVVKLNLRLGIVQAFPLTVSTPIDQPLSEPGLDIGPLPKGVNITFNTVSTGESQVIQISVEATRCPRDNWYRNRNRDQNLDRTGTWSWSVHITPSGFSQSLELQLNLHCQCDCMETRLEDSPVCNGRGALVCGQCECHEPHIGPHCGTNLNSSLGEDWCRSGSNAPVCSGNGECSEGDCACRRFENPEKWYSGRFCECDNFHCPRYANRLCGGHGRCECGECICDAEWIGNVCQCSMDTTSCMATNRQLCNGRGSCDCGMCRCEPPFAGPTCEECPTCQPVCQQLWECVQCRVFSTGRKEDRCQAECGYLNLKLVDKRADLPEAGEEVVRHCKERDQDDCWVYFTYTTAPSGGLVTATKARECPPDLWG